MTEIQERKLIQLITMKVADELDVKIGKVTVDKEEQRYVVTIPSGKETDGEVLLWHTAELQKSIDVMTEALAALQENGILDTIKR